MSTLEQEGELVYRKFDEKDPLPAPWESFDREATAIAESEPDEDTVAFIEQTRQSHDKYAEAAAPHIGKIGLKAS